MNKDRYGTEVKLLAFSVPAEELGPLRGAENLIEWAGRLCYNTQDKLGEREGWIQDRVKDGHETIIEHASATFYIRCSRVVTHELVRHRIASYSQRSQRYVKESEPRYITPPELREARKNVPESAAYPDSIFVVHMDGCWRVYNRLLKMGVKPEIARYVLPNACETQIVCTWNFREIRHIIKLRTSPRALPEMREVAGKVRDICVEKWPKVFGDLREKGA